MARELLACHIGDAPTADSIDSLLDNETFASAHRNTVFGAHNSGDCRYPIQLDRHRDYD